MCAFKLWWINFFWFIWRVQQHFSFCYSRCTLEQIVNVISFPISKRILILSQIRIFSVFRCKLSILHHGGIPSEILLNCVISRTELPNDFRTNREKFRSMSESFPKLENIFRTSCGKTSGRFRTTFWRTFGKPLEKNTPWWLSANIGKTYIDNDKL